MKKIFITIINLLLLPQLILAVGPVSFTEGNLVLYRVGDGGQDLTKNTGTPIFLDEYKFLAGGGIELVQSVPLPTVISGQNKRCLSVSSSVNMGLMSRSADGRFLVVPGYDCAIGQSPWGAQASTYNRVVALVNSEAGINTTTALTNVFNTKDIRSATSYDGTGVWVSGNNSNSDDGGVFYAPVGNTTGLRISTTHTATRMLKIYDQQLYVSVQERVYAAGVGMPKTAGNAYTDLTEVTNGGDKNTNGYGFYIDDLDKVNPGSKRVMYFTNSDKGIKKYSYVNNAWILNGTLDDLKDVRSIEGLVDENGNVRLYVVASTNISGGDGKLYEITDEGGYNETIVTQSPSLLIDYTNTNTTIRSVAWAPVKKSILPVKLTRFDAIKQGGAVVLSWVTASEKNAARFEVLRSDGTKFEVIGSVKAYGDSNGEKTYSFTDYNPLNGIGYYQLRQVDNDNKTDLSKVIPVEFLLDKAENSLKAVVSKDQQAVELFFYSTEEGIGEIIFSDINGRKLITKKVEIKTGDNSYVFPVKTTGRLSVVNLRLSGKNNVIKIVH